ncbi:MAG: alpha/beta hydrolase, partial [Verrucomicrobiota bacterium]
MKLRILSLTLLGVLAVQAQQPNSFEVWDRNRDGRLVVEELPRSLRKNFDRVDRNRDGFISREDHRRVARVDDRGLKGVKALRDLAYADSDNPRQKLDLYLPEKPASEKLPVIVYIHGGAWKGGNKSGGGRLLAPYVSGGRFAGVSVGYRLSGEAIWPAQIHDCKAAVRWVRGHAEEYGLDPDRIGLWGTSAGGHLVAMLGVGGEVETLE